MIATAHRAGTTHAIHRAMAGTIRAIIRVRRCRQYRRVHPVHRDRLFPSRSSAPRIMADRGIRIVTTGGGHVMATTGTTSTSSERRRRVSSGARRLRRNPSGQCGVEGETKPPRSSGYGIGLRGHAVWLRQPRRPLPLGLDASQTTEQQRPSRLPLAQQPSIACVKDRTPSPTCCPAAPSRMSAWK